MTLDNLPSNIPIRAHLPKLSDNVRPQIAMDAELHHQLVRSRLPCLLSSYRPSASARINRGRINHFIGPDFRRSSSNLPTVSQPRGSVPLGYNQYRSGPRPSGRQQSRRRHPFDHANGFISGPRFSYRNESFAIVQSMPGAFPDSDTGPFSFRSSAELATASAESLRSPSINNDATLEDHSAVLRSGHYSPFPFYSDLEHSISRSASPAFSELSSHRSPGRRVGERSNSFRGDSYFPTSFQRRPSRLQHDSSQTRPRPLHLRRGSRLTTHEARNPSLPDKLPEQSGPLSTPSESTSHSGSLNISREVYPRYYDYSEDFAETSFIKRFSAESMQTSPSEQAIPEEEVLAEDPAPEPGQQDKGKSEDSAVESEDSRMVEEKPVPNKSGVEESSTSYDHQKSTPDAGISRLSRASLIPQQLKVLRKSGDDPLVSSAERRSTISHDSMNSFRLEYYDRDQSRDDLSLIASLYASSKFFEEADRTSHRLSASNKLMNRNSLGSLGKHISSSLLWYQEKTRDSLKATHHADSSTYVRLSEDSTKADQRYTTWPAQNKLGSRLSQASLAIEKPTEKSDVPQTPIREFALRSRSASGLPAAKEELRVRDSIIVSPGKSVSFSTSYTKPRLEDAKTDHSGAILNGNQAKSDLDVCSYPTSRTPSPSRPWTLPENYPWNSSMASLQIRNPLSLGPLPPTPSRNSRFKLRISRPSTSIAGTSTLDSFSIRSKARSSNDASSTREPSTKSGGISPQSSFLASLKKRFSKTFFPGSSTVIAEGELSGLGSPVSLLSQSSQASDGLLTDHLRVPSEDYSPTKPPAPRIIHTPPITRISAPRSVRAARPPSSSLWSGSAPLPQRSQRRASWIALDDLDAKTTKPPIPSARQQQPSGPTIPMSTWKYRTLKMKSKTSEMAEQIRGFLTGCIGCRSRSKSAKQAERRGQLYSDI